MALRERETKWANKIGYTVSVGNIYLCFANERSPQFTSSVCVLDL